MIKIYHKKRNSKSIIVFIHGFKGGKDTWVKNDKCSPFIQNIINDKDIAQKVDVAVFSYHTHLIKFFPKTRGILKKYIFKIKNLTNTTIPELGKILASDLKYYCQDYKDIILVSHSMGGLVSKSFMLDDIKQNGETRVGLYISLATPHSGANLAVLGAKLIDNCQVKNMQPLSENIRELNDQWIKSLALPKRIYAYGTSDQIVSKSSAISLDRDEQAIIATDHDHFSIIRTKKKDDTIIIALRTEIKKHLIHGNKLDEILLLRVKKTIKNLEEIPEQDYTAIKQIINNKLLLDALETYYSFERKRGNIYKLEEMIKENNLIEKLGEL